MNNRTIDFDTVGDMETLAGKARGLASCELSFPTPPCLAALHTLSG